MPSELQYSKLSTYKFTEVISREVRHTQILSFADNTYSLQSRNTIYL